MDSVSDPRADIARMRNFGASTVVPAPARPLALPIDCGAVSFIPLSFELIACDKLATVDGLSVNVTVKVIDRSSSRREPLLLSRAVQCQKGLDDKGFARFVRECVAWLMMHELDECLHVNGERLTDPHADG